MTAVSYRFSADELTLTVTIAQGVGFREVSWSRGPGNPWTSEDVARAIGLAKAAGVRLPGQQNTARRVRLGEWTIWMHVMTGPPTWWLPRASLRKGLMLGWLRAGVEIWAEKGGEDW